VTSSASPGGEYGACSVCGVPHRLYRNGHVYHHRKRDRIFGFATAEQCPGAGKPPRGQ